MKLIIDIPNEVYNILTEYQVLSENLDLEYFVIHGIPLEEELEKIKAEIEDLTLYRSNDIFGNTYPVYDQKEVLEILDKHISELKGSD